MTALLRDQKFDEVSLGGDGLAYQVAAHAKIFGGAMVAVNTGGFAVPASADPTLVIVGRCELQSLNLTSTDGPMFVRVRVGDFKYNNGSGLDALGPGDVGAVVYASDDNTVNKTNGGGGVRPPAGVMVSYEAPNGQIPQIGVRFGDAGILRMLVILQTQITALQAGYSSGQDVAIPGSVTTLAGHNPIVRCNPGTSATLTVKFPASPQEGDVCTVVIDGTGTVTVDGNGHNVESATTPESFASTASMSTDNAPTLPSGSALSWNYDATHTRWKVS